MYTIDEGEARILLPFLPSQHKGPGKKSSIFYNSAMIENRTLSVLFVDVLKPWVVLDGFAATGVRGIRIKKECGIKVKVIFNDVNREAFEILEKNLDLNGLQAEVYNENFNNLDLRVDYCDVDPFGSPAPYIEHSLDITKKVLAVTATDTAVLCGTHPKKCFERYGIKNFKTQWAKEVGARALSYFVYKIGLKKGVSLKPIFVYSRDHYIRGYFSISDSSISDSSISDSSISDSSISNFSTSDRVDNEETGFLYDNKIGPLWLGKLYDKEILKKVLEKGNEKIGKEKGSERSIEKLLRTAIEEVDLPGFHDMDFLSSLFRKEQPKIDCLVEKLRDEGYMASRTIFSPKGIKTDAPLKEIEKYFSV